MAISIADKLAALRAARTQAKDGDNYAVSDGNATQPRIYLPDGSLSIHDDVFRAHLELAGRDDIGFLLSRSLDERGAILNAVEINPKIIMRFCDDN